MLTLWAGQAESLWDEALPVEVRELPEDLAALDRLLADPELLAPIVEHWRREVEQTRRAVPATRYLHHVGPGVNAIGLP